ncbi:MAG: DUF1592 domain-containing protein [Planctomycetota bacterium]
MTTTLSRSLRPILAVCAIGLPISFAATTLGDLDDADRPDFAALRAEGARRSKVLAGGDAVAEAPARRGGIEAFRAEIEPILRTACLDCHGPEKEKGGVRIDELDADLVEGDDVDWWLDVQAVLANGEMPPAGDEERLSEEDRGRVVEWLSAEIQYASVANRAAREHSPFRRLTRYEYGFALQDLLGVARSFGDDLPPDPVSEDGFQNSSEVLHLSASLLEAYLDANRAALREAAALGPRPTPLHWSVSMDDAAAVEWKRQENQIEGVRKKHAESPETLEAEVTKLRERFAKRPGGVHYEDRESGRFARATWGYGGAKRAWKPTEEAPAPIADSTAVAILPSGGGLIVELGDRLPELGTMRVRVRAERASADDARPPSLRLMFGWQASNDSNAVFRATEDDVLVDAPPGAPRTYEWNIPVSRLYPRNLARGVNKMGDLPSPSEYIKLVNASLSGRTIHLHHVEVTAPVVEVWPPASYARLFPADEGDEEARARRSIEHFLARAWRRIPTEREVERKVALYRALRPECDSYEEATLEVLAVALTSPHFLYVTPAAEGDGLDDRSLATRLALFLWCSVPDDALLERAAAGDLRRVDVLEGQIDRMLADPRARRMSRVFVRQWLDLALMDNLSVDRKVHPGFDGRLKAAMEREPIAYFEELLRTDASVLDLVHSEYTMANERLAMHYGLGGVVGNHFRRVALDPTARRGGVLAQAGPMAMNSDGEHSHPLKRGIWMLENLLDDPPPPPPPAVPEIDLADPRILEMTLKERIEDHRNHPACMSCHAKIDPWGVAFENFDAIGAWRDEADGRPVDAVGVLWSGEELDGIDGLKGFLLEQRQDQIVRALTHKVTTFALGRPLGFGDRAAVDGIVRRTRESGDGLATMVRTIATSDLFLGR